MLHLLSHMSLFAKVSADQSAELNKETQDMIIIGSMVVLTMGYRNKANFLSPNLHARVSTI